MTVEGGRNENGGEGKMEVVMFLGTRFSCALPQRLGKYDGSVNVGSRCLRHNKRLWCNLITKDGAIIFTQSMKMASFTDQVSHLFPHSDFLYKVRHFLAPPTGTVTRPYSKDGA